MNPTRGQIDMLRAALLPDDRARAAWTRCRAGGLVLERLDPALFCLLPSLWLNRGAAGIEDADLPLLKGVYRQAVTRNILALDVACDAVRLLGQDDISAVFVRGAAALARAPGRIGATTLSGADLLVSRDRTSDACLTLERAGFVRHDTRSRRVLDTRTACAFTGRDGYSLNLHWFAYWTPGDDACVLADADPASLLGRPVIVPQIVEAVLASCVDGAAPFSASLRWLTDLAILLAHDIAWADVVRRACTREVTVAAAAALGFAAEVGLAIPSWVAPELARAPAARRQRLVQRASGLPVPIRRVAAAAEFHRRRRRQYVVVQASR